MPRLRPAMDALPAEIGEVAGLSYSVWLPKQPAGAGVVILHGAGSCKENHHDFARAALGAGLAAVVFDQRGHGTSAGRLDGRVLDDVVSIAALLRSRIGDEAAPLAIRGSSMGGYLAIVAARAIGASAVVAICPASGEGLRRGLAKGRHGFEADVAALDAFLERHDLGEAVEALDVPLLLLHAEGDEVVPIASWRELAARTRIPESRLIALRGGHHRSIQHDPELQAVSLRFIARFIANP